MESVKQQRIHGLSCLVERDEQTGMFIGHCLDYDLMETGKSDEEAWSNLKTVVKHHIEHCYSFYQNGLKKQAAREDWDRFYQYLQENGGQCQIEKIEIELRPPLPEQDISIWIQGVVHAGSARRTACVSPV
jgi:hypothetical protein